MKATASKNTFKNNWLIDLPFDNGIVTWNNKRMGSQQISSKLGRYLISDNSVHLRGDITTSILPIVDSDHWPISLQWKDRGNSNMKPFRFETFWLTHPDFKNMVKSAWERFIPTRGSTMYKFQQRLKHIKRKIKTKKCSSKV